MQTGKITRQKRPGTGTGKNMRQNSREQLTFKIQFFEQGTLILKLEHLTQDNVNYAFRNGTPPWKPRRNSNKEEKKCATNMAGSFPT